MLVTDVRNWMCSWIMTTARCLWRFWPCKKCHQYRNSFTNNQQLSSTLSHQLLVNIAAIKSFISNFLRSTVISSPIEPERRIRFEFPDLTSSDEEIDPLITNAMREYDKYTDWFHDTGKKGFRISLDPSKIEKCINLRKW